MTSVKARRWMGYRGIRGLQSCTGFTIYGLKVYFFQTV